MFSNYTAIKKVLPYVFIVFVSGIIFYIPFGSGDELWNYNFGRCISNGLKPYKDFNMIQTPGAAYISAIFIKVFGGGLFAYRIATYILLISSFCLYYHLTKKVTKNDTFAFIITMLFYMIALYTWVYNYNNLSMLLILVVIDIFFTSNQSKKRNYIIAIIIGVLPLIKQNTGFFVFLGHIFICLFEIKYSDYRHFFKRIILSIIPFSIYILYLINNETMVYFFEYAIVGITKFTHRISYFEFASSSVGGFIMMCFFIVLVIYSFISLVDKKTTDNIKNCFIIALCWISVSYPLCDGYHFYIAIMPLVICVFMKIRINSFLGYKPIAYNTLIILLVLFVSKNQIPNKDTYVVSQQCNYENIYIAKEWEQRLSDITEYIRNREVEGIEVYIADKSSAAYSIALNKYIKNWDMLLVGNIGNSTIEELLSSDKKRVYLIKNQTQELGYQSHYDLIDMIRSEYKKTGEISYFDIYE